MNYKQLNGYSIEEGFNKFNKENPHIYNAFEQEAAQNWLSIGLDGMIFWEVQIKILKLTMPINPITQGSSLKNTHNMKPCLSLEN